jgi:hypothetical protein
MGHSECDYVYESRTQFGSPRLRLQVFSVAASKEQPA